MRKIIALVMMIVALGGCATPLGPPQRRAILEALDRTVRHRLFDSSDVHEEWLAPARSIADDTQTSWENDHRFALAINKCIRSLASHSHVHAPPRVRVDEVETWIPWVTTTEGVSVLRVVRAENGQPIFPGELIIGARDARVIRQDIEACGGEMGSLKIHDLGGQERTMSWPRSPARRSDEVTSRMLPDGSWYLKIDSFTGFGPLDRGNFESIRRHLAGLRDAQALVLDLRGNPGGGRSAMDMATLFFSGRRTFALFLGRADATNEGPEVAARVRRVRAELSLLPWVSVSRILTYLDVMRGRDSFAIELTGDGAFSTKHTIVLIDEGTRSAAEMLASFLHEQCGATLLGRRSAGECAMPVMIDLAHGWRVHLAVLRVASGLGRSIEGRGLEPDNPVIHQREALAMGRDADIEQALLLLAKRRATNSKKSVQR